MPEQVGSRAGIREDMKNLRTRKLAVITIALASFLPSASAEEKLLEGFVIGRVYEIDKERYRKYIEAKRSQDSDFDETLAELDAMEFVDEREEVIVIGRQLATNATFVSELSDETGEYAIRETPVGTYEFTLRHEEFDYPVKQRLDLNVQLDYVAELCFVIDREEQVAWMARMTFVERRMCPRGSREPASLICPPVLPSSPVQTESFPMVCFFYLQELALRLARLESSPPPIKSRRAHPYRQTTNPDWHLTAGS